MGDSRTSTQIRFPPEIHKRLTDSAEAFGLTVNWMVVQAVREMLDNLIEPSEFRLTRLRDNDHYDD